jgi:hypothetical protein
MKRRLPPVPNALLTMLANANLRWWIAVGEWIDNSFDAEASTISLEFSKHALRIVDDGIGSADPTALVQVGEHVQHGSTRLGRYGIGGKDAALWVGGIASTIDIHSVHAGRCRSLSVNWRDYAQDDWWLDDSSVRDRREDEQAGTTIIIAPLARRPPHGQDWQELLAELGYVYSPALKAGHQIKFKGPAKGAKWEPLVRWELPKFDGDVVDTRIEVNGRGARVYCGVVQQGEANPRAGFTYLHKWRVIERASARGCGDHSPARMCGFVELDASWPLTKNKDGISKDAEALYAEVARVAQPVLDRAETVGIELQSRQFRLKVNARLNAHLATVDAKAKRGRGDTHGTKTPTETGRPHQQAEREQSGQTFHSRRQGGFDVDYVKLGRPDDIGEVKLPSQVLLNLDNPMVAYCRAAENTEAIVFAAAFLIGYQNSQSDKPLLKNLPVDPTSNGFSRAVGSILSEALFVDGRPALKVVS